MCLYACLCVFLCESLRVCVCLCVSLCVCVCLCVCLCVSVYLSSCVPVESVCLCKKVWGISPQIELEPSRKQEKGIQAGPAPALGCFPLKQPPGLHLCALSTLPCESSAMSFQPLLIPATIPLGQLPQAGNLPGQSSERAKCKYTWAPEFHNCRESPFFTEDMAKGQELHVLSVRLGPSASQAFLIWALPTLSLP